MKRVLLSACMLAASATFASAQDCHQYGEHCEEQHRPGADINRATGEISVFKPFQPDAPFQVILPPNPIYPVDPIVPGLPPNPIQSGPGAR